LDANKFSEKLICVRGIQDSRIGFDLDIIWKNGIIITIDIKGNDKNKK